jgi:hypothetical protein
LTPVRVPAAFLCGEENQLIVRASDAQAGSDIGRVRMDGLMLLVRNASALGGSAGLAMAVSGPSASPLVTVSWAPPCEPLSANTLYGYLGRHRLDTYGVCLEASDDAFVPNRPDGETFPVLESKPLCLPIPLLRCKRPTLEIRDGAAAAQAALARGRALFPRYAPDGDGVREDVYVIDAGSNVSLDIVAADDPQTQALVLEMRNGDATASDAELEGGLRLGVPVCLRGNATGVTRDESYI